jgi:hypothetical protein
MQRCMKLGIVLLLLCSIGMPVRAQARAADIQSTIDALRAATLAGDIDGALALYAPNATVVSPFGSFTGQEALRGFYTAFLAQNADLSITFSDRQTAFFTEVHRSTLSSAGIHAAGFDHIVFLETDVVPNDRITSVTILLDLSDPETAQYAQMLGG